MATVDEGVNRNMIAEVQVCDALPETDYFPYKLVPHNHWRLAPSQWIGLAHRNEQWTL
jgi:hypothetical protein